MVKFTVNLWSLPGSADYGQYAEHRVSGQRHLRRMLIADSNPSRNGAFHENSGDRGTGASSNKTEVFMGEPYIDED